MPTITFQAMYKTKNMRSTVPCGPVHAAENSATPPKTLCGLDIAKSRLWYLGKYERDPAAFTCKQCREAVKAAKEGEG